MHPEDDADPLPWLTPARFWGAYCAAMLAAIVGSHLWWTA